MPKIEFSPAYDDEPYNWRTIGWDVYIDGVLSDSFPYLSQAMEEYGEQKKDAS